MKKSYVLTLLFSMLYCCTLFAQTTKKVNVDKPGTLETVIGDDLEKVTNLTIVGKLNNADLSALKRAKMLSELNLLDVTLVDYKGAETTFLPGATFGYYPALTSITLPKNITKMGYGAFLKAGKLKKVVLPPTIKEIGQVAFMSCYELSEINLPDGIELIDRSAFFKTALTEFVAPKSLKTLGETAFYGTQIKRVVLNDKLETIKRAPFGGCKNLAKIEIDEANAHFKVIDNVLYDSKAETLITFPAADERTSYRTLPTVKSFSQSAFEGSKNLKELYINEGVKTIPNSLCRDMEVLERLYWPSTLTLVEASAVDVCQKLRQLHVAAVKAPEVATGAFGVMYANYGTTLYVPVGSKASYQANEEWDKNFIEIIEESTDESTIVFKTNKAIGEAFALLVGAKEEIRIKGATYNDKGQLVLTANEVTLYGKMTKLDCNTNKITSIVITNQPQLKELYCDDNELKTIEFDNVPQLSTLYCGNNKGLTNIDFKKLPALSDFSCYNNGIKQLDFSANPLLTSLICRDNMIEGTLDLSQNPKIQQINCYNNMISEIKLAANSELRHLEMQRNNIKGANMTNLMKSLPTYIAYDADQWDDYGGLNLQGIYVAETSSDKEKNVALASDVKIAKDKLWPVLALNIDDYGMVSPKPYEGAGTEGINTTMVKNGTKVYANGQMVMVEGLPNDETVLLYSANGMLVDKAMSNNGIAKLNAQNVGIYFVKLENQTIKVVITRK